MTETLLLDRPQAGTVVLQLNRPKQLNAINEVMRDELTDILVAIGTDTSVNVVVLAGAGRGFCSGIDVRDFGPGMLEASAPAIDRLRFQEAMAALPQAIWDLPQPVIAAVNGPCVGAGFALCLASDIRICSTAATFGNGADARRNRSLGRYGNRGPSRSVQGRRPQASVRRGGRTHWRT